MHVLSGFKRIDFDETWLIEFFNDYNHWVKFHIFRSRLSDLWGPNVDVSRSTATLSLTHCVAYVTIA